MAKDLTALSVRNAKAQPSQKDPAGDPIRTEIPDGKARGLFLVVQPSGAKSWALRYRFAGKPKKLTIGPVMDGRDVSVDDIPLGVPHTLAEARTAADRARMLVAQGVDPAALVAQAKAVPEIVEVLTVKAVSEAYMRKRRAQKRNRSADEVQRQFDVYILPAIGAKPIAEVTGAEARKPVKALATAGKTIMANRLHATLATFFKWAAEADQGHITVSPYAIYGKPEKSETARDRVLSNAELAKLWHEAGNADQPFGPIVKLLILTGQRRSEVTGMREHEVDRNRAEWIIPAARAKNGQKHIVPLSAQALAVLSNVVCVGDKGLIFSTDGKAVYQGHQKAKERLDADLQFPEHWRLHDIRRTVASGLAGLGQTSAVIEALLNHKSGVKAGVAGVYNHHQYLDEAELALAAWGRYIVDVIAVDARRVVWDAMRARARAQFRSAIQGEDEAWCAYADAMADGPDSAWQAYLASLGASAQPDPQEAAIAAADNVVKLEARA